MSHPQVKGYRQMRIGKLYYWLFLLPCIAAFILIILVPAFTGLYYSLTDWNGIGRTANFVGLSNFTSIFSDGQFWYSFLFSALFALVSVLLINTVGFLLALLVTRPFKGRNFLRSVFFMPNLIGGLLLGFAWQFIFTKVFNATNIPFLQNWLTNAETGFIGLMIVMIWQMGGYMMIIYIAALENIPQSVNEAAAIDGASGSKRLFRITLPMVAPSFTIGLFLTLSNSFKLFDQNLALTKGGPNSSTQMLALNIYQTAFSFNRFGEAQAKALIFLVAVAIITGIQLYVSKKGETEL